MNLLLVYLGLCQDKCNIVVILPTTRQPYLIWRPSWKFAFFCDASISNINQHILKYIQTKFHAFTMKCTMVSMIRCTIIFIVCNSKKNSGQWTDCTLCCECSFDAFIFTNYHEDRTVSLNGSVGLHYNSVAVIIIPSSSSFGPVWACMPVDRSSYCVQRRNATIRPPRHFLGMIGGEIDK